MLRIGNSSAAHLYEVQLGTLVGCGHEILVDAGNRGQAARLAVRELQQQGFVGVQVLSVNMVG